MYFEQTFVILKNQESLRLKSEEHLSQTAKPEKYFGVVDTKIYRRCSRRFWL